MRVKDKVAVKLRKRLRKAADRAAGLPAFVVFGVDEAVLSLSTLRSVRRLQLSVAAEAARARLARARATKGNQAGLARTMGELRWRDKQAGQGRRPNRGRG